MKKNSRGELFMALFFLTFFSALTIIAMTYSPKARRLPLIVAIPGVALSAARVLQETRKLRAPKEAGPEEEPGLETADPEAAHLKKKLPVMIGWMVLLVAMIWIIGFLATIPVYTILYMRSMGESWRLSLTFALCGFLALYFLFVQGLNVELYPGLIFRQY